MGWTSIFGSSDVVFFIPARNQNHDKSNGKIKQKGNTMTLSNVVVSQFMQERTAASNVNTVESG